MRVLVMRDMLCRIRMSCLLLSIWRTLIKRANRISESKWFRLLAHPLADAVNRLLGQVIDMVEKREIYVDSSVSVNGLDSLQSSFAALIEGTSSKQVVSLANVDDQKLIKVSVSLSATRLI